MGDVTAPTVRVRIEALAGLPPEAVGGHEIRLDRRGSQPVRSTEAFPDRRCGSGRDVDAGQIHQLERPERKAGVAHRRVDRLDPRGLFLEDPQGFDRERPVDAVDNEAGRVGRADSRPTPGLHERRRPLDDRRIRLGPGDDLHETHDRRRVEEVEPEDAVRVRRRRGDRGDRQGARIRREDGRRIGGRVEGSEDRPLQVEILQGSLDHHIGLVAELLEDVGLTEPADPLVDPVVDPGRVLDRLRRAAEQAIRDPVATVGERGLVDVVEDDLVTRLEGELGNARAHDARPDDADERQPTGRHQTGLKASKGWRHSRQ
jgi:hypothetical protein